MTGETPKGGRPWVPIDQATYDRLQPSDQRYNQLAMMHAAYTRAGPMFSQSKGRALHPEEMSDHWREWTARGDRHRDEAERLRKIIIGRR